MVEFLEKVTIVVNVTFKCVGLFCAGALFLLLAYAALFLPIHDPAPLWWETAMWRTFGVIVLCAVGWVATTVALLNLEDRA